MFKGKLAKREKLEQMVMRELRETLVLKGFRD